MALTNPLREALTTGRFCYMVEVVATRMSREAQLLEFASQLAQVPGVVAGSITSYAGGAPGHDPLRVGTAARARGLTPNIHLTCVSRDRVELRRRLEDLCALEIENVFAMTGDFPKGADKNPSLAVFDLDSVQLVRLIDELRQEGMPFWTGVAVSPFKSTEADCTYQYIKLEKKIAAGANYAITQLGYDARKFRELKRYLDERVGPFPVLGNVYVLGSRASEKMASGDLPGCWVSPELQEIVKKESQTPDKGLAARLERAARTVAVLRGLGFAGAYLGGTHNPAHIKWIIKRSEKLRPRWEELAEELVYAPQRGFYLFETLSAPPKPRGAVPNLLDALVQIFPVNKENVLRRFVRTILRWVDRRPALAKGLERFEFGVKSPVFGCEACGNCVLGRMEYVCPQTCPKHMRNGPCGGTDNGKCEVVDKPCIWVSVYERAKAANEIQDLRAFIPAPGRNLKGTSSWINYFLNRDVRPDNYVPPSIPPSGDPGETPQGIPAEEGILPLAENNPDLRSNLKRNSV
jgi:methylenetetrahydrofolate reductase (NADPH)